MMVHKWYNVHHAKNGSMLHVYAYYYTFLETKKTTGPALTAQTSFVDVVTFKTVLELLVYEFWLCTIGLGACLIWAS